MLILKGLIFLSILKVCNSFPFQTIISSFEKYRPIPCMVMVSDHYVNFHDDIYIPIYQTSLESLDKIDQQAKYCGHFLIKLKNESHVAQIKKSKLITNAEKVVVVFETFLNFKNVKKAFRGIKQINNLVVFVKRETKGYTIYEINDKNIEMINVLIDGKFILPNKEISWNKMHGLKGKGIKVTSFDRKPFAYKNSNGEYEGYEVSLMKDLSKSMGFTWDVVAPTDGGLWGEIKSDGSATGLVGDIKYEKSDIGSANLYITHERTKHIAYTKPYHTDASCFFLKKDPPLPKWMDMIVLFQLETWVAALLTFIFCTIFLMIVYAIIDERKVYSIPIWMTAIIFDESIPFIQRIRLNGLRIFMALFLFMFYTITMSYRGSLNSILTVTLYPKPIDTVKDLSAKIEKDDIYIGSHSDTFQKLVAESEDPDMTKIAKRFFTHYDDETAFKNASNGLIVMGESKRYLEHEQRKQFTNEYGETTMHVAKECFGSFLVAYAVPKDSPYKAALDKKISLMIEAGLPDKYYNDEMEKVAHLGRAKTSEAIAKPLTLYHLQAPLYLLPILLALAVISFIVEITVGDTKKSNPDLRGKVARHRGRILR